ncbi:MAG: TetR/AcrR family transcriptional regulator [Rhodocyclaceae bacterium]|nr:TetR/AcrR family transcriptional regulator [Rhodocyclaceae bacterium]
MEDAKGGYHHGNLREALLDVAEQLLAEQGAAQLSLRAVARAAGVSHAAPYRHFPDKAALLRGVGQRGFEALERRLRVVSDGAGGTRAALEVAGRAYIELALANPERTLLMLASRPDGADQDADFRRAAVGAYRALAGLVEQGVAEGVFGGDPAILTLTAWSGVHGFAMLALTGNLPGSAGGHIEPTLMTSVVERVVAGLCAD